MARTDEWRDGDPVSLVALGHVITGIVLVRHRHADGKRFVKVRITSGPRAGTESWPDRWVIGQGPRAGRCLGCEQPFRTADPDPTGFCPPCDRRSAEEHAAGGSIRKVGAYLRGATTPAPKVEPYTDEQRAEIAAQRARDEQESPF